MNLLNQALLLCLIAIPTLFGFNDKNKQMALSAGAITVALFFANLDKFSRFKGAGLEAEMREAVSSAYAAIKDLRKLALVLAGPDIADLALLPIDAQPKVPERFNRVTAIRAHLKELGVKDSDIELLCAPFYEKTGDILKGRVFWSVMMQGDEQSKALVFGWATWNLADWPSQRIRSALKAKDVNISEKVEQALADLEHFEKTHELKSYAGW